MNEDREKNEGEEQLLRSLRAGASGTEPEDTESEDTEFAGTEPATEPSGTEPAATEPAGAESAPAEPATSLPPGDEEALRDLLRGVVGGIEPSGNALERLRYAVPARRVRKRRILVAAGVALLVGTSVPTTLHLVSGTGGNSDRSTMAGHGQQDGNSKGSDAHQNGSGSKPKPKRSAKDKDRDTGSGGTSASPSPQDNGFPDLDGPGITPPGVAASPGSGTSGTVGGGALPPQPAPGAVPFCTISQVGVQSGTRSPSADGKVYGSFRVTNVSSQACTVRGPETLTAAPATGPASADGGAAVAVVNHVTGDPATGLLPDPSVEVSRLVLAPRAEYEVRFAWVPSEQGCPAANGSGGAGAPESGSTDTGSTDGGQNPQPQADVPGVAVSHTPNTLGPDGPTTRMVISEACAGTVYRTGVIPMQ